MHELVVVRPKRTSKLLCCFLITRPREDAELHEIKHKSIGWSVWLTLSSISDFCNMMDITWTRVGCFTCSIVAHAFTFCLVCLCVIFGCGFGDLKCRLLEHTSYDSAFMMSVTQQRSYPQSESKEIHAH